MTDELLNQINQKNNMYREWKSSTDINQYNGRGINFQTYEKIIKKNIENAKHIFYHNVFKSYKTDMKNTWSMINETLNRIKTKMIYLRISW